MTADAIAVTSAEPVQASPQKCSHCGAISPAPSKVATSYFGFGLKLYHDGTKLQISDRLGPLYSRVNVREVSYAQVQR